MIDRPSLVALPGYSDRPRPATHFCGHCGRPPIEADIQPASRVCSRCNLGLMVAASPDVAPTPDDPFLMVDGQLSVCAVSKHAEDLLLTTETEAVNRHIADLLVPADVEISGPEGLVNLILHASRGDGQPENIVLRPAEEYGIRFWARVGPCGPPRAALIVLADGRT